MVRGIRGFTLIELMIAVVIVAILASVAYPSYQAYLRQGHRSAAQAFMMEIAQRQQNHLMNSRSYASTLTALSYPADTLAGFPRKPLGQGARCPVLHAGNAWRQRRPSTILRNGTHSSSFIQSSC